VPVRVRRLTPPSSGQLQAGCAVLKPPLMSSVRPRNPTVISMSRSAILVRTLNLAFGVSLGLLGLPGALHAGNSAFILMSVGFTLQGAAWCLQPLFLASKITPTGRVILVPPVGPLWLRLSAAFAALGAVLLSCVARFASNA
jgi:hypothetical protein